MDKRDKAALEQMEIAAMDNPYWHKNDKPHVVEKSEIEALCLEFAHIIYASHGVSSQFQADGDGEEAALDRVARLHHARAEPMLSRALLRLAVLVRTFDDQMQDGDDDGAYVAHRNTIDAEGPFGAVHDGGQIDLSLRESCNKIIHAADFRPVYDDNDDEPRTWFMDSTIELRGRRGKQEWNVVIYTFELIEAILTLIEFTRSEA